MKKEISTKVTEQGDNYCVSIEEKPDGNDIYHRIPFNANIGDIVTITYELENA